jgi:uncharacterized repeat protein (TIGR02543 family)
MLAANLVCTASATEAAAAELEEPWQFQFYRVTGPTRVFFASIPSSLISAFWIQGLSPKGLTPTLGIIDRYEITLGKFEENEGLIFLYMKGNLGEVPTGNRNGFDVMIYDPIGRWVMTITIPGAGTMVEGTTFFWVFPGKGFVEPDYPLGNWRIGVQTLASPLRTLFNASFTVGKYFADISVDGLPNGTRSGIDLDGSRIGEMGTKTSIGLGWFPEHTISLSAPDVALDRPGSRYHAAQSKVKVSSSGEYHFEYVLQYYLTIQSPHPINGYGWFNHGEAVSVSAPAEVGVSKDSRDVFRDWSGDYSGKDPQISVVMDAPKQIAAQYATQYRLTVFSTTGSPQGSGWYDAGSSASFSVTSPVSVEGFMGMLGGKYVFDHWSGDSTATSSSTSITMDGPRTVTAEWRTDNTMAYALVGAIGAAVIIITVLLLLKRRK